MPPRPSIAALALLQLTACAQTATNLAATPRLDASTVDRAAVDGGATAAAVDVPGVGDVETDAFTVPPAVGPARLTLGAVHGCALDDRGAVRCWGDNTLGQIGDGTTTPRSRATTVDGLAGVTAVAAGNGNTCAIVADGAVRCWGENGSGNTAPVPAPSTRGGIVRRPTAVPGVVGAVQLAPGETQSCARLRDGTVACWGLQLFGGLGDGVVSSTGAPRGAAPVPGLDRVVDLAAHRSYTCAVRDDGGVLCWGDAPLTLERAPSAVPTAVGVAGAVRVVPFGTGTCALRRDGTVVCWGYGTLQPTPRTVEGLDRVVQLVAGEGHQCALRDDGTVWCWGLNLSGQLGDGSLAQAYAPSRVEGLRDVVEVFAGGERTCARERSGRLWCWGSDRAGELGLGTTAFRGEAFTVPGVRSAVAVAAGGDFTCALRADGSVSCWGNNFGGQLGDGSTTERSSPVEARGVSGVRAIVAMYGTMVALRSDGAALCWGSNYVRECARAEGEAVLSPVALDAPAPFVELAAGRNHGLARDAAGGVWSWGSGGRGELGRPSTDPPDVALARVPLGVAAARIAAGGAASCAVAADGAVRCWGGGGGGRCTPAFAAQDVASPTVVPALAGAGALAFAEDYGLGRLADGTARAWGVRAPLDPTRACRDPGALAALAVGGEVTRFAPGLWHACALRGDRTVVCWGDPATPFADGAPGAGAPTAVPGLVDVVDLAAGSAHTCAVVADGTVRCWGRNGRGQLGDGAVLTRLRPVEVRL